MQGFALVSLFALTFVWLPSLVSTSIMAVLPIIVFVGLALLFVGLSAREPRGDDRGPDELR